MDRKFVVFSCGVVLLVVGTCVWIWAISTNPEWPAYNIRHDDDRKKDLGSIRLRRWDKAQVCVSITAEWSTPIAVPTQTWMCHPLDAVVEELRKQGLSTMNGPSTEALFYGQAKRDPSREGGRRQSEKWSHTYDDTAVKLAWVCPELPSDLRRLQTAATLEAIALIATPIQGIAGLTMVGLLVDFPWPVFRVLSLLCGLTFLASGILLVVANTLIGVGHTTKCIPLHPSLEELGYTREIAAPIAAICLHFAFFIVCVVSAVVRRPAETTALAPESGDVKATVDVAELADINIDEQNEDTPAPVAETNVCQTSVSPPSESP